MKATFQIPDDLYREVKAETAREGRTVREVAIGLFEQWLTTHGIAPNAYAKELVPVELTTDCLLEEVP